MSWYWYAYIALAIVMWGLVRPAYDSEKHANLFCLIACAVWPLPVLLALGRAFGGHANKKNNGDAPSNS